MSRLPDNSKPIRILPSLAVLAFVAAAATQGFKQIVQSDEILDRAQRTGRYLFTTVDAPRRGSIYSSDGEVVAQNQDAATVGIRFDRVPNSDGFHVSVAEATGIPASELRTMASSPDVRGREWRKRLSAEQVKRLEVVKREWRADGLSIHRNGVREYPLGASLASVLGIIDENRGQFGIEKVLDPVLAGREGRTVGIVDKDGAFLPMRLDRDSVKRSDGKDVVLTIDSELQDEATRSVRRAVENFEAKWGVAIVMDPQTGDLLAMASWPSFDPDDPAEGANDGEVSVGVNPAYMMAWEPGSTFKALTLAMALETGGATMNTPIACTGSLNVWTGTNIRCDEHAGTRAHGTITPIMAIAKSCNVSAATWAKRVGYERFVGFIDGMGLTTKTGIPATGEVGGRFKRDEYAKGLQLATFGFGQSLTVTPLGMIDAFALLANKGIRMKPRLVRSIGGAEQPLHAYPQTFKAETCEQVLDCMKAVIETNAGTGKKLRIPGYELGGKTGTAQKIGKATEGRKAYVSNFVGFVPAKQPEAVILVMIDDPKTAHYGAEVAGPVFLEIARKTIERMHIPPTKRVDQSGRIRPDTVLRIGARKAAQPLGQASPPPQRRSTQQRGPGIRIGSSPVGDATESTKGQDAKRNSTGGA